ncbi:hypothetical protein GCM10010434_048240 [Winogradskya humida]
MIDGAEDPSDPERAHPLVTPRRGLLGHPEHGTEAGERHSRGELQPMEDLPIQPIKRGGFRRHSCWHSRILIAAGPLSRG